MIEKIGQVVLDNTYGTEDEKDTEELKRMLEIAQSCSEEEWNRVIAESKDSEILYQFSHIRENVLSWIPFSGEESVLEIGAGCGAVTGLLCQKAAAVTSIEQSEMRSRINAWRHKECKNLRILTGDFRNIEKNLHEKYDYITMIDVLEYSEQYVQGEDPYTELLKVAVSHLKPDGRIILSMENRLGLKYWAGCPEGTSGKLFEGLEGYPTAKGVRTFSKKELMKILHQAGDLQTEWFYPFPDHRLPMTIYSDRRLPVKGELNRLETDYDRLRVQLFQESAVYDSLIENEMYPEFANSFLVLISKEKIDIDTIYMKYSNERAQEFSIRTEISEDSNGKRLVRKLPSGRDSEAHVKNLEHLFQELKPIYENENLELNHCLQDKEGVCLEYLEGETLEEQMDQLLEQGRIEELEKLFFTYVDKVRRIHDKVRFHKTEEFVRVFGDAELSEDCRCGEVSNIDLVPANILIGKNRVTVIDYEWTFRFPIPCNFILYRMIHYYLESDGKRCVLKLRNFYEKAGITEQELESYGRMEQNFQNYMKGKHVSLLSIYGEIAPGKIDVVSYYDQMRFAETDREVQVFYDRGNDFCEKDSAVFKIKKNYVKIPLQEDVRRLRLDPGEAAGGLILKKLSFDNGKKVVFNTNGFQMGGNHYYFGGGDPQFIIQEIPKDVCAVEMKLEVMKDQDAQSEFWNSFSGISAQKDQEIQQLKQQIQAMENTKVWKLYRSIKKQ